MVVYLLLRRPTARRVVQDIATDEQSNALPRHDGDNWLCKYDYLLQSLRVPLTFDQLVGPIDYVEGNKSRVFSQGPWATAFSNNIMMAGKHYVSFQADCKGMLLGVMRPGEATQNAYSNPLQDCFYGHFTQRKESVQYNNSISCCMYDTYLMGVASHTIGSLAPIILTRLGWNGETFFPLQNWNAT